MTVAVLAVLLGAGMVLDGRAIAGVAADAAEYRRAGGYVMVVGVRLVGSDEGAHLAADECEDVRAINGVVAAGPVTSRESDHLVGAPATPFSVIATTPDGARTLTGRRLPTEAVEQITADRWVLAGADLATELGLSVGRRVTTPQSPDGVLAGVIRTRLAVNSRSLVYLVAPEGGADACWIETEAATYESVLASVAASFATEDASVSARRLLDPGSGVPPLDPSAELKSRATRQLPALVGAVAGLVAALGVWGRRSVTGMYRTLSLSWQSVAWVHAGDLWCSVLVAGFIAADGSALILAATSTASRATLLYVARSAIIAVAVCGLATTLAILLTTRGSAIDQLKDR